MYAHIYIVYLYAYVENPSCLITFNYKVYESRKLQPVFSIQNS